MLMVNKTTSFKKKGKGKKGNFKKNGKRVAAQVKKPKSRPKPETKCFCFCRCTKVGALLLTPLLVHGQSEPRAAATLSRAEEGSRREAKAQDNQGNAKTRNTEGEVDSLGKILAEAASAAPARALPGQLARCQRSKPPLSP